MGNITAAKMNKAFMMKACAKNMPNSARFDFPADYPYPHADGFMGHKESDGGRLRC